MVAMSLFVLLFIYLANFISLVLYTAFGSAGKLECSGLVILFFDEGYRMASNSYIDASNKCYGGSLLYMIGPAKEYNRVILVVRLLGRVFLSVNKNLWDL